MNTERPNHRHWFQFRLRALLVAVLVLSLPLSWFAVRLEKARQQEAAVEVVSELGGLVMYSPSETPRWLVHVFPDVHAVILTDHKIRLSISGVVRPGGPPFPPGYPFREPTCIRDGDLAVLKPLRTLEVLIIHCRDVTDAGLTHVQGLTRLTRLDLSGTQVTARGVKKLQEALPNCEIAYDKPLTGKNE